MTLPTCNFESALRLQKRYTFVMLDIKCIYSCFVPFKHTFSSARTFRIDQNNVGILSRNVRFIFSME